MVLERELCLALLELLKNLAAVFSESEAGTVSLVKLSTASRLLANPWNVFGATEHALTVMAPRVFCLPCSDAPELTRLEKEDWLQLCSED